MKKPLSKTLSKALRENSVKALLSTIKGEDPTREGLQETPKRVANMYDELTSGYGQNPKSVLGKVFETENDQMVVVKDIDFYSLCGHHMVPFFGKVHIGYIPKGKVLGLSKFARLVEIYARRLQIQEQMTHQIAEAIQKHLKPEGVIVVIEAQHLCMAIRGVQKQNSKTITSSLRGNFLENLSTRQEFFNLIK